MNDTGFTLAVQDRPARRALGMLRAGVLLAAALLALESSVTHVFVAAGYADLRLGAALWLKHFSMALAAGVLAAAGPAALVLAIPSPRGSALGRVLVPRILLALYAITLQFGGPLPWTLLKGSVFLALAGLSALAACAAIWWSSLRHSRRIAFVADAVTWAALLWISIGPLAGLHFGKAAETAATSITMNVVIPIGCIVAAIVLARRSSASTRPEGARAPRHTLRRVAVPVAVAGYALLALAAAPYASVRRGAAAAVPSGDRFDLVLVIVDTLRADRLGAYGYARAKTPAIDGFASRAVLYADHMSAAPWTLPSFATLLTGRSPGAHGARRLSWPADPAEQPGIPELGTMRADLPTLATILKDHGYETAFIGTNWALSGAYGLARGFDVYSDPLTTDVYATLGAVLLPRDPWESTIGAAEMTDRFLEYLDRPRERPVALVAHYMDPHVPYAPPDRFRAGTAEPRLDAGATPLEVMSATDVSALYDGEVAYVDEQFGRLWRFLEQSGRLARTVVVLTSDHGETMTWRQEDAGARPASDAYAGRQLDHGHNLSQDLLHVPFVLYAPDLAPRAERTMTRAVDVLPTLLDALHVAAPPDLEGRSVRDRVETPAPALAESVLYGLEKKAWRAGRYKLLYRPGYPEERQFALYDLDTDPHESRDIAAEQPDVTRTLATALLAHLDTLASAAPTAAPMDPAMIERLRSLGYVK